MRTSPSDATAQRIFTPEVDLDEPLVGHHNRHRVQRVALVNLSTQKHRDLHGREKSGPGMQDSCFRSCGLAGDENLDASTGAEERCV